MTGLERRILDISYKHKLSHLGSCLTAVSGVEAIYKTKKEDEPFILSNGHAGLALYCVLEAWGKGDAEKLFEKHGVHPNRDLKDGIVCSTGSLGHGIGIGVGMAIADKSKNVYVMLSDGECAEGSVWEALRIAADLELTNLRVTVLCNGYSAYKKIDVEILERRLTWFYPHLAIKVNVFNYPEWMQGLEGHYVTMNEDQYKELTQ